MTTSASATDRDINAKDTCQRSVAYGRDNGPHLNRLQNETGTAIVDFAVYLQRELSPGLLETVEEVTLRGNWEEDGIARDRERRTVNGAPCLRASVRENDGRFVPGPGTLVVTHICGVLRRARPGGNTIGRLPNRHTSIPPPPGFNPVGRCLTGSAEQSWPCRDKPGSGPPWSCGRGSSPVMPPLGHAQWRADSLLEVRHARHSLRHCFMPGYFVLQHGSP